MKNKNRYRIKNSLLLSIAAILLVNVILFREFIFLGKVPIAFDYAVAYFQPWKLDFESSFAREPKKIGHDDIRIFYPQRKFIADSLKNGVLPFWNPYEFTGNVSLANSQAATFYPPFLLFLFIPQIAAWSILSFSIPIIAGIGMLLFLRQILKNEIATTFGALVFAFSSSVITRTEDGLVAGHSIIWLPWVLFAIELFLKNKKIIGAIILGISLIFSMLAGWFQFTFYVYFIGALYALFCWWNKKEKRTVKELLFIILIFLLSTALTAFHWLPALEALNYSPRGIMGTPPEFLTRHLMPISHLITLLIPNFFGHIASDTYYGASEFKEGVIAIGLVPFLLAVMGVFKGWRNQSPRTFFILLLVGSLLLGLKTPIAKVMLALKLPMISTFLPNRILFLAAFSLSVLSGYGMQKVIEERNQSLKKILKISASFFALLYLLTVGLYTYEKFFDEKVGFSFFEKGLERYVRISITESLFPLLSLAILSVVVKLGERQKRQQAILTAAIIAISVTSQLIGGNRYLYFSQKHHEFPDSPIFSFLQENAGKDASRFLSLSFSRIPTNVQAYYNLYSPEGVAAMYPIWFGEFAEFFLTNQPFVGSLSRIEVSFADDLEKPRKVGENRWLDLSTINFLSHLGVRYIIVPRDYHYLPPAEAFEEVFSHGWHTIYEYKYAFPKAYFVPNYVISEYKFLTLQRTFLPEFFTNSQVILSIDQAVVLPDIVDKEKQLTNNEDLKKKYELRREEAVRNKENLSRFALVKETLEELSENPVELIHYSPNRVILNANVKEDGFIVLNDSFYPSWRAQVDGIVQPVLRANHAFRAVSIRKGQHTVTFFYHPQAFNLGLKLSLIASFIAVIMLLIAFAIKTKN